MRRRPNVLLIGAGEYTTGLVHGKGSKSEKKCGVVGLVHFDLRKRGIVGERIGICDLTGQNFPAIRSFFKLMIEDKYKGLSATFESYPEDNVILDYGAYERALLTYEPGDICVIFVPDDAHYKIALAAIERGLHTMVAKPIVQTLIEHQLLVDKAREKNVLLCCEYHKRFDPCMSEARMKMGNCGDFSFYSSFMSQNKVQIETFKKWAGRSSDISYYLNSHFIDIHTWAMEGRGRPMFVTATSGKGVAKNLISVDAEDTITIMVQWENLSGSLGSAVYTASWAGCKSDCHTQQRFYYLGHTGEVSVDQCRRGYYSAHDELEGSGFRTNNPLYMRYIPNAQGEFAGQHGYGYVSFERFADAVNKINAGNAVPADFERSDLATAGSILFNTAILEAGRKSLDHGGRRINIVYHSNGRISTELNSSL